MVSIEPADVSPAAGSWQDVDVSSYVPDTATGAIVQLVGNGDAAVREKGSTDNRIYNVGNTWSAVGLDGDGVFQAYVGTGSQDVYLTGYTASGWHFKTNDVNISLGATLAWTDIDVTANTSADTVAVLVEAINTHAANVYQVGLRKNGSADNRTGSMGNDEHYWAMCGVDGDEILEGYIGSTTVDFYLSAYYDGSNLVMQTNATDKSLGVIAAWTDIDCSAQVPAGTTHVFFEIADSVGAIYGFRCNGVTATSTGAALHNGAIAPVDSNRVCEGYISNLAVDFYLMGYVTSDAGAPIVFAKSVTATGVSSGERKVITAATGGGTNLLTISVYDENNVLIDDDSVALGGASVPNNSNNWSFITNGSMPYMDYQKIWVGGTLVQHIVYERDTTFDDLTAYNNDATPTFVTASSDPDVSASLMNFRPIEEAECAAGLIEEEPELMPEVPEEPEAFFGGAESGIENLPGAAAINELLAHAGIPEDFFWILAVYYLALGAVLLSYHFIRSSLLWPTIVGGAVIAFFSAVCLGNPIPFWTVFIFGIRAAGWLIAERTFGW